MAHLWACLADGWTCTPLEERPLTLIGAGQSVQPICESDTKQPEQEVVRLVRFKSGAGESWQLVAGRDAAVRVNGEPLLVGIRTLRDRDAIAVNGGDCVFFSTERLARVESFEAGAGTSSCARCKQVIDSGHPVVRCPACGVAHHQHEKAELPCWTGYEDRPFPTCANCDHPATVTAEFTWNPDDI